MSEKNLVINLLRKLASDVYSIEEATLCLMEDLEQQLEQKEIELQAKQAQIDELMLEYCPSEMSVTQIDEWEQHQKPVKITQ